MYRFKTNGFTIVELLIVIVVIAILATISVAAYNGIQQRARDSQRSADLSSMQKALELYHAEKGGYPLCSSTGTYVAGGDQQAGLLTGCVTDELVPDYVSSIPQDPVNSVAHRYHYAVGYQKTGATTYNSSQTDNYIIGVKQETVASPVFGGWGYTDLTLLVGSSN